MPTGVEEFAASVASACAEVLVAGAELAPFTPLPPAGGYADFEAEQSCNPLMDQELADGSYADPGACVCYDDSQGRSGSHTSEADPAPAPVTGDKPSASPQPAAAQPPARWQGQKAGGAPAETEPADSTTPILTLLEPDPLLEFDTKYLTLTVNVQRNGRVEPEVQVKDEQIIRDVFGLNPDGDPPSLPGDDARASIQQEHTVAKTVLQTAAGAVGAGGVSDALNDLVQNMAEDKAGLDDEQVTELSRRLSVSSFNLVVELLKVLAQGRMSKIGGGESPKSPRKSPTLSQTKKKLEIYKQKLGQPDKTVQGITRTTVKPDKPPSLGKTGPNEVTGIWNENKNIEVKVTSGAQNPRNVKSVEVKINEVQKAKPSIKQETITHRRGIRESRLILKGKDAGHVGQRAVIDFEDPANYWQEDPRYNRNWKNLRVESKSRSMIRDAKGKGSMTLSIQQDYSEGPGMEEVTTTRHILTTRADGKTVLDLELDLATGKVVDRTPVIP